MNRLFVWRFTAERMTDKPATLLRIVTTASGEAQQQCETEQFFHFSSPFL